MLNLSRKTLYVLIVVILFLCLQQSLLAQQEVKKEVAPQPSSEPEFNTLLMQSTFMLIGQGALPNTSTIGTGFILGRPAKDKPGLLNYVLITADHVFKDMSGSVAKILLRRQKEDKTYEAWPYEFKIRDEAGTPLWTRHPDQDIDVATIYISLPTIANVPAIPMDLLCEDSNLDNFEIHPGDELISLGYPLGISSPIGAFPVLRSGKIASYPLTPTKKVRSFFFDFQVYRGNSGGPVYFIQSNRIYGNTAKVGETIRMVMGLVSGQVESKAQNAPVYLASIVPSQFIKETIMLLPKR